MKFDFRQKMLGLAAIATLGLGGFGTMAFQTYVPLATDSSQAVTARTVSTQAQDTTQPAQNTQVQEPQAEPTGEDGDTIQDPNYTGSVPADETKTEGMTEEEEAAALQGSAKIAAAAAEAAAVAANPGTTVVKSGLDNENGVLVYSVELSNGLDVKVDAGNGTVLHTDQDNDSDESDEDGDHEGGEGNEDGHEANEASEASESNGATESESTTGQ